MKRKTTTKRFFITGFGRFHGCDENATEKLIEALRKEEKKLFGKADNVEVRFVVFETSIGGVDECLKKNADFLAHDDVTRLHFGVLGPQSTQMQLERYGYNELNFRVADERGEQPTKKKIADENDDERRETSLPVDDLLKAVNATIADGFCKESDDPGRFLCNYSFYLSLMSTPQSLFIHCPRDDDVKKRLLPAARAILKELL